MDCSTNIVTANFSGGKREAITAPLWQWDYGQVLCITGIEDLPAVFEVHFSTNRAGGVSTGAVGADGQVTIPNVLLTIGKNINAWIYLSEAQGEGETEYSILIPVKARPMPETYDAEVTGEFDDVVRQVSEYAETAQTAANSAGASATAAAGSASAAAQSAASIEGDVQIASQKASEAQTAAGQAVTAKEAAQTAQQGAETAATNAGQSASTATAKAAEAATSASGAAQSKTDAEAAAARAEQAAASLTVDSALSDSSTNPVQNKVIAGEFTDVKSALSDINEKQSIDVSVAVTSGWVTSHFVSTNKGVGAVITVPEKQVSSANYNYIFLPVVTGDTYVLTGTGGGDARLYTWLDSDHKLLSKSDASLAVENLTLTASQDGYLVINVNKSYDHLLIKNSVVTASASVYTLADFGAVGDGSTDDTDAIQTALNYCKDIYIPEGTYVFSKTIFVKSGTHLHGAGEASVLQLANSFTLTPYTWREDSTLVSDHNRYPMIMIEDTESGCMLSNFKLRGQTDRFYDKNCEGISVFGNNHVLDNLVVEKINYFPADFSGRVNNGVGYGIRVAGTTVSVRNCAVSECGYEGIGLEDADTVLIENCNIGYSLQTGLQVHRNCQHIHVLNNTINCFNGESTYRPGITLHSVSPYVLNDINIEGNYVVSSIMFANGGSENDVRISNNFLVGVNVNDFDLSGLFREKWVIIGNTITQNIRAKCDKLLIANNVFTKNGSGTNIIHVKSNKYLIENNLAAGTAKGIEIEPH